MLRQPLSLTCLIALAVYGVIVMSQAVKIPHNQRYNWDMIPYVAAAIGINESKPDVVYAKTLKALQKKSYHARSILQARRGQSAYLSLIPNAESLRQQLVWFVTKPVYVWSVWAAKHAGASWDKAPAIVNVASYLLAAVAFAAMTPAPALLAYWLLAVSLWLPFSRLADLCAFATPDMQAFALVMAFMAIEMRRASRTLSVICCMFIVYTRADLLPLVAGIMLVMRMPFTRASLKQSLAVLALLVGMLAVMYRIIDYPGWQAHMVYAMQYKSIYPQTFDMALHFDTYATRIKEAMLGGVFAAPLVWLVVLSSGFALLEWKRGTSADSRQTAGLIAVVWLALVTRLLLFPNTQERFYRVHVSLVELLLMRSLLVQSAAPLKRVASAVQRHLSSQ
jgi:hypothetical protein